MTKVISLNNETASFSTQLMKMDQLCFPPTGIDLAFEPFLLPLCNINIKSDLTTQDDLR